MCGEYVEHAGEKYVAHQTVPWYYHQHHAGVEENMFTDKGAKELAKGLSENRTLLAIFFGMMNIMKTEGVARSESMTREGKSALLAAARLGLEITGLEEY